MSSSERHTGFSRPRGSPHSSHWSNPAKATYSYHHPQVRSQPHHWPPNTQSYRFLIYELPPRNQCDLCKHTSHHCLKPLAFRQNSLLQPVDYAGPSPFLPALASFEFFSGPIQLALSPWPLPNQEKSLHPSSLGINLTHTGRPWPAHCTFVPWQRNQHINK